MEYTLDEWINRYENSIDTVIEDRSYIHNNSMFEPDKGFMTFEIQDSLMDVKIVCGDGMYWFLKSIEYANSNNLIDIRIVLIRELSAFARFLGFQKGITVKGRFKKPMYFYGTYGRVKVTPLNQSVNDIPVYECILHLRKEGKPNG